MADPMRIRADAAGDKATVRVLMAHEMEAGQRKDAAGKTIPARFIQEVTAQLNGNTVLTVNGARRSRRIRSCSSTSGAPRLATRSASRGWTTRATSAPTKRPFRDRRPLTLPLTPRGHFRKTATATGSNRAKFAIA